MTAVDLLHLQISQNGSMLKILARDVSEEEFDKRISPNAMTYRETFEHLTEALEATNKDLEGASHEWGSFKSNAPDSQALLKEFFDKRLDLCTKITEENLGTFSSYIAMHEPYHVGQLSVIRQTIQPDWSSFSLYAE